MDENIIAPEDLERPNAPKFPAFTTNYTLSADKTIGAAPPAKACRNDGPLTRSLWFVRFWRTPP